MKFKELKKKGKAELEALEKELKLSLLKERGIVATKTGSKNPMAIRNARRTIAKIKTINAMEKTINIQSKGGKDKK